MVNRTTDRGYDLGSFLEAVIFELDEGNAEGELEIAGWARLLLTPVNIDAPITPSDS